VTLPLPRDEIDGRLLLFDTAAAVAVVAVGSFLKLLTC
jgi:hypothetical protein